MKKIIVIILLFINVSTFGQPTVFLNQTYEISFEKTFDISKLDISLEGISLKKNFKTKQIDTTRIQFSSKSNDYPFYILDTTNNVLSFRILLTDMFYFDYYFLKISFNQKKQTIKLPCPWIDTVKIMTISLLLGDYDMTDFNNSNLIVTKKENVYEIKINEMINLIKSTGGNNKHVKKRVKV